MTNIIKKVTDAYNTALSSIEREKKNVPGIPDSASFFQFQILDPFQFFICQLFFGCLDSLILKRKKGILFRFDQAFFDCFIYYGLEDTKVQGYSVWVQHLFRLPYIVKGVQIRLEF